ncbi:peptidase M23 [Paenibacillus dendritiformis]|uniref:peptidoglycan DD-metalloendopeptidase family protein n=1 Tax=Paenibacillus TaxID=44249 RepID=UPI001B0F0A1D|nr:peptidoglycan DD-metalloendopeptidase family protein [Paenibacillus dendritiformis]GIO80199.1 peptidase M23 [Paenibacillus dendritiformis]
MEHSPSFTKQAAGFFAKKAMKKALKNPIGMKIFIVLLVGGILITVAMIFLFILLVGVIGSKQLNLGMGASTYGNKIIPPEYLPMYQEAEEKYGVPWGLLAAIHKVETNFSRDLSVSQAGAVGHMQFMKKSWIGWSYPGGTSLGDLDIPDYILTDPAMIEQYGGYGVDADGDGKADPMSLPDSVHSAANYLAAHGATEGKYREAVFAYNHSKSYVEQVLSLAERFVGGYIARVPVVIIDNTAWPLPDGMYVTSLFGTRWGKIHKGIDIAASGDSTGKSIVAFAPGKVIYSGLRGSYGFAVIIDHGNGVQSLYAHMQKKGLSVGTIVQAGTPIGYAGNTGDSLGAHLHFEIHLNGVPVDPLLYVKKFNPTILDE